MSGTAAIQNNLEALKRILAGLFAMAGLGADASPLWGGQRSPDRRVGVIAAPQPDAARRPPHKGEVKQAFTLPRHLRLAILRLLRPAESAARRLIVASARGLIVALPPPRKLSDRPASLEPELRRFGIAIVASGVIGANGARRAAATPTASAARPRRLPLADRPRRPPGLQHIGVLHSAARPAHAAPRISFPQDVAPRPGARAEGGPPSALDDPVDATRLAQRLTALAAALDDLPGEARRLARWQARRRRQAEGGAGSAASPWGVFGRSSDPSGGPPAVRQGPATCRADAAKGTPGAPETVTGGRNRARQPSPLRPGRPPGGRFWRYDPAARRPAAIREVDQILAHAHALALHALENPDTS
ncbi:hypothetical protein ABUE31_19365 [Mesorhizobium sp. ZMM04-5]|uniref:Uncharacterized protein n=1 Tax=Mesorhizobium marinum TaxID=3228790 RepID=A0ABV3R5B9_9HYPH